MLGLFRTIVILSVPLKHSTILMTDVRLSFYKPPTVFSIASKDTLFVSFHPEPVLQVRIINFNFETVRVTWSPRQYSGTNLTFVYK